MIRTICTVSRNLLGKLLPSLYATTVIVGCALADQAPEPPHEIQNTTQHRITVNGKALAYTATAGTLIVRDDDNAPTASMFYVAYTAKNSGAAPRPVTFLFNGGPGSASLWLNIGGFGPVHVPTKKVAPTGPAPYAMTANADTLLDKTDLVFIDAIGTGYSRAVGKAKESDFWGVDSDVQSFTRAIKRYIALNNRWNSPKFLLGESYGTTRAAALVLKLQDQDIDFNGVILMSTILNFADLEPGMDQGDIDLLPSFAAAALYHGKAVRSGDDAAFLQAARAFARGPYASALAQGSNLPAGEKTKIAQEMSRYIGIPAAVLEASDLRMDMEVFRKELLRDQGKIIGRFDSRFTGPASDSDEHSDPARDDPATAGVSSAYLAGYRAHLSDLGFHTDMDYRALYNMKVEPAWDWHHKAPGIPDPLTTPDVALDLGAAMRSNPHLKVLSLNGLYDMATPFFGTEYDLSRLFLPKTLKENIVFAYYGSGHMVYTDPDALKAMKKDIAKFFDRAAPEARK